MTEYLAQTDLCSYSKSRPGALNDLRQVYYVAIHLTGNNTDQYGETIIPWVSYNSSKSFKEYVRENIDYSLSINRRELKKRIK